MAEEVEWFVGIDWASENHQVCLVDAHGKCCGERSVAHGGAGIAELCDWLMTRTGAKPEAVAVAIEMPHGPVVEALLERGFRVYAINPKQLDRFRDRFTVAGAKSLPRRRPGMTGATGGCWQTACAPIGTLFGPCRSTIR
jgi:transposase